MIKKAISFIFICILSICISACGSNVSKYEKWSQKYIDQSNNLNSKDNIEARWYTETMLKNTKIGDDYADSVKNISKNYNKEDLLKWDCHNQKCFEITINTNDLVGGYEKIESIEREFKREFDAKYVANVFELENVYSRSIYKSVKDAYILKDNNKCTILKSINYNSNMNISNVSISILFHK